MSIDTILQLAKSENSIYHLLETLCICFPARLSGSDSLESALDFFVEYGSQHCLQCVEEMVSIPNWRRGVDENCTVEIVPNPLSWPIPNPLCRRIRVLANGMSIGTPSCGINANIILVHSWDELETKGQAGLLTGCIVLCDYKHFSDYSSQSSFRNRGANNASKYGAVGVLIRTLAPDISTSGPHTGSQVEYDTTVNEIPAACVAIEDAELMRRLIERGHTLKATLTLPCYRLLDRSSRNLVFTILGTDFPDEIVVVGGHSDSWDCQFDGCQGAHDDGQGVVVAFEIVRLLTKAGIRPRRTIKAVLFVDEECRQSGAKAFLEAHRHVTENIVAAIETDMGAGPVVGFGFSGTEDGRSVLLSLLQPLAVLGDVTNVDPRWNGKGVDITPLIEEAGVPGLLLRHADSWWDSEYFHMHHSTADTIDHVDPELLVLNLQVVMGAVWLLANSDEKIPR